MKLRVKIIDLAIIFTITGIVFFSIHSVYFKPRISVQVLVQGQGGEWTFPVSAEETVIVEGPLGNTIVKMSGNRAWVESSPCENQTCVATGFVTRQGQWAACLPNNVLLMIRGGNDDVDAVAW